MTKRIAFYLFYDQDGIVDDYIPYKLSALREFVDKIVVISNSSLTYEGRNKLEKVADQIFCRENIGFDVWGYKEGMELYGYQQLAEEYDELILLNYTFFGPIYPFAELFEAAGNSDCDFWGISEHDKMVPNPFTGHGVLPKHIQSHFIAVKKKLLSSPEFSNYWQTMPMINSYTESILQHESRFTKYFEDKGFKSYSYLPAEHYPSPYATFIDINKALENRCPILKRRLFFHDPLWLDINAIDLNAVYSKIQDGGYYDVNLINDNILRTVKPRTLYTNLELLKILPTDGKLYEIKDKRIAVVAHLYYPEMFAEIEKHIRNIPVPFDIYISTATKANKVILEEALKNLVFIKKSEVRVVEKNRGRDMSALFITFKDICKPGIYDYICRLHSKKSPQNGVNSANHFKEHLYDNLLASPEYVSNLISFMDKNKIGLAMPPVVHISYPTHGHSWFSNRPNCEYWADKLKIKIPFDDNTPVAPYGTMFWFKPEALEPIFNYPWKWEDFNEEPAHVDGGLAHVLERLIGYATASSGYFYYCFMTTRSAEKNYSKLEFKYQSVMSQLPNGDVSYQTANLANMRLRSLHGCMAMAVSILKDKIMSRYPRGGKLLKWPYKVALKLYKIAYKWNR
ncbi:rhamnan synthesis F family protein [Franconibacter helveticus 513]|uniref:rhamnan synthesis F family protein n=1 Tax=Franconibacter helveticus TaxID=357240 RepID=UPI0003F4EE9C|nr:rhamnan synthesis F family protein [Franconibacter helveticus]